MSENKERSIFVGIDTPQEAEVRGGHVITVGIDTPQPEYGAITLSVLAVSYGRGGVQQKRVNLPKDLHAELLAKLTALGLI